MGIMHGNTTRPARDYGSAVEACRLAKQLLFEPCSASKMHLGRTQAKRKTAKRSNAYSKVRLPPC